MKENLCEELGDVLLQVRLHAGIAEEEGQFTMADVVNGLAEKMVRRLPMYLGMRSTVLLSRIRPVGRRSSARKRKRKSARKLAENQGNLLDKQ